MPLLISLCTPFQAGLEPQAREAIRDLERGALHLYLAEHQGMAGVYRRDGDLRTRVKDHLIG